MDVGSSESSPGRDFCREVRRPRSSLGRHFARGGRTGSTSARLQLRVQARRISNTPTTYAAFLCLPHACVPISQEEALLIGLSSGSVEAISNIEEPWKQKCPGERDGAVSRHLRASGEDEFLSVVVLCRDSACYQLESLSPLLHDRHSLSPLLEYWYFYR